MILKSLSLLIFFYAVNKAFYLFSGFHLPLSTLR